MFTKIKWFFQLKLPDLLWHDTYGRAMAESGYKMGRHALNTFQELKFILNRYGVEVVRKER